MSVRYSIEILNWLFQFAKKIHFLSIHKSLPSKWKRGKKLEQVDHSRNDSLINVLGRGTSRQRVEPDDKTGATISGCYYRVVNHPLDRQFAEGVHGGAQTARHAVPPHGLAQRAVKTGHPRPEKQSNWIHFPLSISPARLWTGHKTP